MRAWRGKDGKYLADGLPHVTKIKRKPESVGAELKSVCCGQSGVLLHLNIMEGKDVNMRSCLNTSSELVLQSLCD